MYLKELEILLVKTMKNRIGGEKVRKNTKTGVNYYGNYNGSELV